MACGALELAGARESNDQHTFDQSKLQKLELCDKNSKKKSQSEVAAATFVKVNIWFDKPFDGERAPKFQIFSADFSVHEGFNLVFG
jgi:hypothetical protein